MAEMTGRRTADVSRCPNNGQGRGDKWGPDLRNADIRFTVIQKHQDWTPRHGSPARNTSRSPPASRPGFYQKISDISARV